MVAGAQAAECLGEDDILALATGARDVDPAVEAHLATCASCSALVASAVRAAPARAWNTLTGTELGPYRIEAQIGAGGMGAVYRAFDQRLGRVVAIKVLHEQAGTARRLSAEARAAAAIDHKAIVKIHDVGTVDDMQYVAMELIEGENLRARLRAGPLGIARTTELVTELADALAAAHARGVIHRDLKPENLVVGRDGLRILDFGLAKLVATEGEVDETQPGLVQGTAGYMAPEQARGEPADARADIFAWGAIAYELATGKRAFDGATHADRLSATLRDAPPLDDVGPLAPIIARCLAKDRRDRFQSAADLTWALGHTSGAVAPTRPPSRRALLVGGLASIGAATAGYVLGTRGRRFTPVAAPVMRGLTHRNGRVYTARFSRDGTRIVYAAQWDDAPLRMFAVDAATGETTALDLPPGDVLSVSSRGELAIALGLRFIDHQSARGQLALVPLVGGVPRALAEDIPEADFVSPETPGGDPDKAPAGTLAIVRPLENGFRIEVPLGTPLVEEPGWITHLRVSPSGRHIAYLNHPHVDDDGGALIIVDIQTRAKRTLTDGWISIAGLVWDPRGDSLWFTASKTSLVNTLHRVSLIGAVTDIAVPAAGRIRLHDLDPQRNALITVDNWRLRARAGDHDCSQSNISWVSDLSSDGAQLLLGELGGLQTEPGAYLVPYAGGRALRLGPGFPVAISPSGQRIAANVREADRLVVYAVGSGDMPAIPAPGFVVFARWLDEQTLIGLCQDQLWRLSVGASPEQLASTGARFALDPERRRCAFITKAGELRVLDVASRTSAVLLRHITRQEVCGWLANPDAILVCSKTTPIVIDRIDPATGARTPHLQIQPPKLGLKAIDSVVMTADGQHHAYSYGEELSQLGIARGLP
jgi:hypothetical protein